MKVLRLSDKGVKEALNHPAIAGKTLIGRGTFSLVFDNGDTVLKLTTDSCHYEMLKFYSDDGVRFPKVLADHGVVGVQGHMDLNLYLIEVERLEPITVKSGEWKLVKALIKGAANMMRTKTPVFERHANKIDMRLIVPETLFQMAEDKTLPTDVKEALDSIARFSMDYEGVALDFHRANFMVRPSTGAAVFSDPVYNLLTLNRQERLAGAF